MADYEEDFEEADFVDTSVTGEAERDDKKSHVPDLSTVFNGNKGAKSLTADVAIHAQPNEKNLFDFLFKKRANPSVASSTRDFHCQSEAQTELIRLSTAWTQKPCYSAKESSGLITGKTKPHMEQNNEAVKLSLLTQNKADVIGSQPGSLNAFLKKSSNLILSMMTEERHKKSILKAERSKTDDTRTVTDQVSVPLASPLFSAFGNIISIRTAQNCASPLFLVLHATKDNSPPVQSRFRGCVSGWNGYSPGAALFILGLLERPTCLDSFSDSDGVLLVVAGVIDGSIACWDVREPSSNAIYFDQESQIVQLPCFVSCATTPSHTESVLDIATIQPGSRASSAKFVVSLDESGIVIVWNVMHSVKEKGRNNENTGAGQTVELVRSRTIDIWRNCPKRFVITTIYSDGRSTNQAFVTSSNGHLLGVFMQSSQSTISYINTAGGGFTSLVTTMSFSQHFPGYFLVGYDNGRISLYNTAYRICLNSWSLAAAASIVGLYWSETNPKLFYSVDSKGNIGLYKLGDKISETPSQISTSLQGPSPAPRCILASMKGHHLMLCQPDQTLTVATVNSALDRKNTLLSTELFSDFRIGQGGMENSAQNGHLNVPGDDQ